MINYLKMFLKEEDGLGTVEMVLILAVLVGIALMFKSKIEAFVGPALEKIFGNEGMKPENVMPDGTPEKQ